MNPQEIEKLRDLLRQMQIYVDDGAESGSGYCTCAFDDLNEFVDMVERLLEQQPK